MLLLANFLLLRSLLNAHCISANGHIPAFSHTFYRLQPNCRTAMLLLGLMLQFCDFVPTIFTSKLITIKRKFDATLHLKQQSFHINIIYTR